MRTDDLRRVFDQARLDPGRQEELLRELLAEEERTGLHITGNSGLTETKKRRFPLRPLAAAAVVAALCALMGAAFAASPTLRAAVISFFRLPDTEQIEAARVRLEGDGYSEANGVLYQVERDGDDPLRPARQVRFWNVADGQLVELETRMTPISLAWEGGAIESAVYWCLQDGRLACYCDGAEPMASVNWTVQPIPGRTDVLWLNISEGRQIDFRQYPVLLWLDTGEVEDILAGTGVDRLERPSEYSWSPDLRRVVISDDGGRALYLCVPAAKTLAPLELPGGSQGCGAVFVDDHTLLLTLPARDAANRRTMTCEVLELNSGERTRTLTEEPVYRAFGEAARASLFVGGRSCLRVCADGAVFVLDLVTGLETPVENFSLDPNGGFLSNADGTKLLYYVSDANADGLGVSQLGALDLERGVFFAFDRADREALRETSMGWFDNDRVGLWAETPDGGEKYLLLYRFPA